MNRFRRSSGDRGAAAVEFALVAPVVLLLLGMLGLFAFRSVYSGLAANASRAALRTAMLPQEGTARGPVPVSEVYASAVCAVPGLLRPDVSGGGGAVDECRPPDGSPPSSVTPRTDFGVQVCPPACDFGPDVDAVACPVALPARSPRLRALSVARVQVVPQPTSSSSGGPTFGGLVSAVPTPSAPTVPTTTPTLPSPPPVQASPEVTLTPGVQLPTELPTPTPVPVPLPTVSPALPSPAGSPVPAVPRCAGDDAEGRLVVVQVTWRVPGLSSLAELTDGALGTDLATVRSIVSGRRE